MKRTLTYGAFCLIDHGFWLLIQLLPGAVLIGMAKQRPWQCLSFKAWLTRTSQQRWLARIDWLLRTRCRRAGWGSTCLSRSISGRLIMDLIGVANELHLGMSKFKDGHKVPHAWLVEASSGRLFTPGLTPNAGVTLTKL